MELSELQKMDTKELVQEILKDVCKLNDVSKRLRLAVTHAEYVEIMQWMLTTYGEFYGRIRDISLVVDENAEDPPLWIMTE